ncbi:MAG: DUF3131 domain-containing protein [Shimia sp.]
MSPTDRSPRHRGSLALVLGLAVSVAVILGVEGTAGARHAAAPALGATSADRHVPPPPREIDEADLRIARAAWSYIARNTGPSGLVNSVDNFPSTTLWDQGSFVFGILSAERLGVIGPEEREARLHAFLAALGRMTLVDGALPNKVYDTRDLAMTAYDGTPRPGGIGWSALDLGRLLVALRAIEREVPALAPEVAAVLAGWDLSRMAEMGDLIGTAPGAGGGFVRVQEGRIGYEQYAARAAALWGLDVGRAMSASRIAASVRVEGIEVARDRRRATTHAAITPVLSEPYLLMGLEMGFDPEAALLARRVLAAQAARHARTGILTALSEDHLDVAPHFAYAAVYSNGRAWAVVDESGRAHEALRTFSAKAAFGWEALFPDASTRRLAARARTLALDGDGVAAGIYEVTGEVNAAQSLNTNGVVLTALAYRRYGPVLSW